MVSTALRFRAGIRDLKDLELCYAPVFGTARDVVNLAAMSACDQEDGLVRQVAFTQVRSLLERGEYFLDVRDADEFASGHIKGAVNIPLGELRGRLGEIPRDRPVYVYCRTGQRSYNAARALMQLGYPEIFNVAGSFLALSWYEYYHDVAGNRERILTAYNFD